jgi:hypothetical protein
MASPGECWTLNTTEFHSAAVESSLLDIVEPPGMHLQRYFLTPRAAAGILRRSERRSRPIPEKLRAALLRVSQQQ